MEKKYPNEWTQEQYMRQKIELAKIGVKVLLIDTIANEIDGADTVLYNRHTLKDEPKDTVLVFYCDSGKATHDRLKEYKKRFVDQHCISLKGGRGNWRKYFQILDLDDTNKT